MLSARDARCLRSLVEELQKLVWLRLEERGILAVREGRPRLEELLQRPLGLDGDDLPELSGLSGPIARLVEEYDLSSSETLTVVAALAAELDDKFDLLFGALVDRPGSAGLTVEALRNLLNRTFDGRLLLPDLLAPGEKLRTLRMLTLEGAERGLLRAHVRLNPELASWLCGRQSEEPEFSNEFPALRLRTVHSLEDLVLPADVRQRIETLLDRIRVRPQLLGPWGFSAHHDNAAGLHVLFHGPSGTGKTMAAAVIGAEVGVPVYRIDLSLVVSKYIGETEKNLAQLFERAEARNWILFFDEADALFGRRGEVNDARDRYANQEVSYLLQRVESFAGVTILATNLLRNVDEAFLRRIHVQVPFRSPERWERMELWRSILPPAVPLHDDVDFEALAEEFDLTGGQIRNAVFHAASCAAADGGEVRASHIRQGIRAEYEKSGRMFPSRP